MEQPPRQENFTPDQALLEATELLPQALNALREAQHVETMDDASRKRFERHLALISGIFEQATLAAVVKAKQGETLH